MSETISSRTFEITQYETDPKTGKPLFSEENIRFALQFQTIERWSYIRHDKDVYSEEDEAKWNAQLAEAGESPDSWAHPVKAGRLKPAHWHIVVYCKKSLEPGKVAEWFGVPENRVRMPKGHGAFWSVMKCVTHEHMAQIAEGKHRYADEEVKSNVEWRRELDARDLRRKRYCNHEMDEAEQLQFDVMTNGLTMAEAMQRDPTNCMKHMDKLEKLRVEYLAQLPPPRLRVNYYIEGPSGSGKSLLSRALARSLCPDLDDDSKIFFEAGRKGSPFDGYDGQRVIIWDDRRASDFRDELHGSVLNVFDPHPTKMRQNTRHGSTVLVNEVNIINGPQPFEEFISALADDKKQGYRRFPFVIRVHKEDLEFLLNKGCFNDNDDFGDYIEFQNMRENLKDLAMLWRKRGA